MDNQLTGGFDAVVQVAARQVNGLLATLHQDGASEDAPLRLLHRVRLRIGDVRPPRPELGSFGDWVLEFQRVRKPVDAAVLRGRLIAAAPPGAAARLLDAFGGLEGGVIEPTPIRGTVEAQVSSVTVSVPFGSTSEVTIHAHVRAHYRPDPNTTDLPSPIHGEVRATFDVRRTPSGSATRLVIQPSADDGKIQFIGAPGSGLDPVEASVISAELRKVLRHGLELMPVDLPPGFPFDAFKGVGLGDGHAIALPIQLSGTTPPPDAIEGISQSVVGPSGFAFAVGKEFVNGLIDLEAIREAIKRRRIQIRISTPWDSYTVTYKLRFSSGPTLTFRAGAIDISGKIAVETGAWYAPNGSVEFKQAVRLALDPATQRMSLERIGEPDVDESYFIPHGRAVNAVREELDHALDRSELPVRKVFDDARTSLRNGLKAFDRSANPFYVAVEITADGIVVRGDIGTAPRPVPVVDVRESRDGSSFSALESWIPGGRVERLVWSWVDYTGLVPTGWSGVTRSVVEEHRFLLPKPPGITDRSSICLRIEGALLSAGGRPIGVAGGTMCLAPAPDIVLEVPAWFEPVTLPIWQPDVPDRARVRDALAGHVSVLTISADRQTLGQNTLVFFADWRQERPLEGLGRALAAIRGHPPALSIVVVAPVGAFDERRKELEAKLAPVGERFAARVHLTEDDEGGWTRTFAVTKLPATFLVNARRQFVWSHEGVPGGEELVRAFDRFLVPAPPPLGGALRLAVAPGAAAPDVSLADGCGGKWALHRKMGRPVWLTFWQSWCAASLRELRRLAALHERAQREGTSIIGIHGGTRDGLDRVRKELSIPFPLLQDAEQQVAAAYGVRCWPTTIAIDARGRVEHVQFGTSHDHASSPCAGGLRG